MTDDLARAYVALDLRSREAIVAFAARNPDCLAAAVGAAMVRGVSAGAVAEMVEEMSPGSRRLLLADASRQARVAESRGASTRSNFYSALAVLADRVPADRVGALA